MLRRLLRRAARHGRKLGIEGRFLAGLSETVIELSKDGYPELEEKQAMIFKVLSEEEEKFNKTIDQGLSILGEMEDEMQKNGNKCLSGANAFKLYDTYGKFKTTDIRYKTVKFRDSIKIRMLDLA